MLKTSRILVTGASGLVGKALTTMLAERGYSDVIAVDCGQLDLTQQLPTYEFFNDLMPECVFHLAARVGGIRANIEKPAEFMFENLNMQTNVIEAAYRSNVKKLLFMGCSCIYPKDAEQPLHVDSLFRGTPEPTNDAYAHAKIAGIKMCEAYNRQYGTNFITAISSNVFGENDNFSPTDSHVVSAIIQKVYKAKQNGENSITLWGTGTPLRELIYVQDLVSALIFCMEQQVLPKILNIGTGEEITIEELAKAIRRIFEYPGDIIYDTSKPDGTRRKVLDGSELGKIGWKAKYGLIEGLKRTIDWYVSSIAETN